MLRVKDIVKELKVFERYKVPLEIKVLGIATYIQIGEKDCKNSVRVTSSL